MTVITIKDLSFHYENGTDNALSNISLKVEKGDFLGIAGPSGAGKTTLSLCINGVIPNFQRGDYSGQVVVDGKDAAENGCAMLALSVGSVFQDPEAQIVTSVVEDEIAFGLENMNMPRGEMESRIEESLKLCGILELRKRPTSQLSGGQKQRVAIASAIALRPGILMLDEPTSELDPSGSRDVFNILKMLNKNNAITIVIIEQKMELLAQYCSRLVIMDKGRIALDGDVREVLESTKILEETGVCCPPAALLFSGLKRRGLYEGPLPLNVEEAFKALSGIVLPPTKEALGGGRQKAAGGVPEYIKDPEVPR